MAVIIKSASQIVTFVKKLTTDQLRTGGFFAFDECPAIDNKSGWRVVDASVHVDILDPFDNGNVYIKMEDANEEQVGHDHVIDFASIGSQVVDMLPFPAVDKGSSFGISRITTASALGVYLKPSVNGSGSITVFGSARLITGIQFQ